jgi:AsmA protein
MMQEPRALQFLTFQIGDQMAEHSSLDSVSKPFYSRLWFKILGGLAFVLLLLLAIAPRFIDINRYRPELERRISLITGRQVTLGKLSLSLLAGTVSADEIAIADDPAYSQQPFFTANSVHIGIEVVPLLRDRTLIVTHFSVNEPKVILIHKADGTWNYSSLYKGAGPSSPNSQRSLPEVTVRKIVIHKGTATLQDQPATRKPIVLENLDVSINDFSLTKEFPFDVAADLQGGGVLSISGNTGPLNATDTSLTPLTVDFTLKDFNAVGSGIVDPSIGVSAIAQLTAHTVSDGKTLSSSGTIHAEQLKLPGNDVPIPQPVDVDYTVTHDLAARTGQIEKLNVKTGGVAATISGAYRMQDLMPVLALKLNAPSVSINQIQALIPSIGAQLPTGSRLQGGTATASLNITGPANALVISGPVGASDTRMENFDLLKRLGTMGTVSAKAGLGSGNVMDIKTFHALVNQTKQGTRLTDIYLDTPAFGTSTGSGTVSPAGAVDIQLSVQLTTGQNTSPGFKGQISRIKGKAFKAVAQAGSHPISFHITGTGADPKFDVSGLMGSAPKPSANVAKTTSSKSGGFLGLHKKKE